MHAKLFHKDFKFHLEAIDILTKVSAKKKIYKMAPLMLLKG